MIASVTLAGKGTTGADRPRTAFYLGETYRNLGNVDEAEKFYLTCAELSHWDEEKVWSLYQLAQLQQKTDPQKAIITCLGAMTMRPDFPELPWFIAYCELDRRNWLWAKHWAQMALGLKPQLQRLGFVYPFSHREGPEQIIRLADERLLQTAIESASEKLAHPERRPEGPQSKDAAL